MCSEAHQHSWESEEHASSAPPDEPMQSRVKPLAVGCKIFATIEGVVLVWFLIGSWYLDMHSTTPPREGVTETAGQKILNFEIVLLEVMYK